MKFLFTPVFALLCLCAAHAADFTVEAVMAVDADTKPATTFAPDAAKLNAFFKTSGSAQGDVLRGILIAEDVGDVAPPNTKVLDVSVTGDKADFTGAFTFSKPTKGWPPGKYRVEILSQDKVVATVKFTVAAAK